MEKKKLTKPEIAKKIFVYCLMTATLVLMIVFSIQKQTPVIKLIPCCISIVVQFFNSSANRYAKLIGGCNCILYSIGYMMDGLWGSFLNAILISSTIQFITFARWNKNKYKQSTIYRSFSFTNKMLVYLLTIMVSIGSIAVFRIIPNSNLPICNGILFGISLSSLILIIFGYVEGMKIGVLNCIISLGMYVYITIYQDPGDIHYIFIDTYNLIMTSMCLMTWLKLYKEQTILRGGKPLKDFEPTTLDVQNIEK